MEHVPCEHCEEVRREAEDAAFAESLKAAMAEPKGSLNRRFAEEYIRQVMDVPPPIDWAKIDGPVTFKFWSDLDDD